MDEEKVEVIEHEETDGNTDVIYINVQSQQLPNSEEDESNDLDTSLSTGMMC